MTDDNIIELYWNRDEQAIPVTADRYGHYCTTIAWNILGNREDAEECVSDTWLQAWNSMPPHRPSLLAAFLGKITRNLSFNRYKRNNALKRGRRELTLVLDELGECVSGGESVEEAIERQQLVEAINHFLGELSPEKRGIFLCRYCQKY